MSLLEKIKNPSDLKKLSVKELPAVAEEIRARIISVCENNGGHLASSLGAVDAIVALYYVFDFPKDKIIFDVGHQAYAH
ncbi:MAG TPA: 1-deoxy-D-xylulose-5-phosphate synthase, partial [Clostridiales bacterium]|nr:1-deoxy-D-xylulose-5-phosphate synthase [Clostridiales bacterium]